MKFKNLTPLEALDAMSKGYQVKNTRTLQTFKANARNNISKKDKEGDFITTTISVFSWLKSKSLYDIVGQVDFPEAYYWMKRADTNTILDEDGCWIYRIRANKLERKKEDHDRWENASSISIHMFLFKKFYRLQ